MKIFWITFTAANMNLHIRHQKEIQISKNKTSGAEQSTRDLGGDWNLIGEMERRRRERGKDKDN